MILEWSEPPQTSHSHPGRGYWQQVTAVLRTRPGEWAQVEEGLTKSQATDVYKGLRKCGAESTTRKVDGEGWAVWARWAQ